MLMGAAAQRLRQWEFRMLSPLRHKQVGMVVTECYQKNPSE
jgi:hypothetical protein